MRPKLLLVAAAGLLLAFLPGSQAQCDIANCTTEADAATPTMETSDQKCRNLALYKTCLERESSCSNITAEVNAKKANLSDPVCVEDACTVSANCTGENQNCTSDKCQCTAGFKLNEGMCVAKMLNDACAASTDNDCGASMICTGDKCVCKENEGDNGMGVCATSCAPSYKGDVDSCALKELGDNCTTDQTDTCPEKMQCSQEGKCECKSGLKNDGTGTCAENCKSSYGDDGTGQCAMNCTKGYSGVVDSCTQKKVNESCTANDNSTCGMNQWCQGNGTNAKCMCQPAFKANSSMYCVAENGAQKLPLTLSLHLLPLGLVLALSRWM